MLCIVANVMTLLMRPIILQDTHVIVIGLQLPSSASFPSLHWAVTLVFFGSCVFVWSFNVLARYRKYFCRHSV